ncbi:hypothetical protein Lesp02_84270 [Lentzea sp. NBRC 105346]|uniref:hypothetical protein n=1 Tax=Lentzea sp. NBRC 105346 TaxID=3032205 RepID=UPI0024A331F1|nr:hypothetical protein [Lentzea sp. NBRC 105346]GLZ36240.1 hypothetical protein Lesp02_84270 [Lentzea sp. NBRC 105346]
MTDTNIDRLPVALNNGTEDDLLALGFELGEPDPDDPLFRSAVLPARWSRTAGEVPMWTYIVDEHGRRRCAVFYNPGPAERIARMSIADPYAYGQDLVNDERTPLVLDDWATAERLIDAVTERRRQEVEFRTSFGLHDKDSHAQVDARIAACDRVLSRIAKATEASAATASN